MKRFHPWTLLSVSLMAPGLVAQNVPERRKPEKTRTHYVADIVDFHHHPSFPPMSGLVFRPPWHDADAAPGFTIGVEEEPGAYLLEFVRSYCDKIGVTASHGTKSSEAIRLHERSLVVRGPTALQEAVQELLDVLRRHAAVHFLVEAVVIPEDGMSKASSAWKTNGPWLPGDVFDQALLDARSRLISTSIPLGRWVTTRTGDIQGLVTDYEINQTGVIPVTNPVVDTPLAGYWLEARALPLRGQEAIWLDFRLEITNLVVEKGKVGGIWSDLDLPVKDETRLASASVLPFGKTLVAGQLGGQIALLRVRRQDAGDVAAAPRGDGSYLAAYNASLLSRVSVEKELRFSRHWEDSSGGLEVDFGGDEEGKLHRVILPVVTSILGGGEVLSKNGWWLGAGPQSELLLLHAPAEIQEKVERYFREEAQRLALLATVDLELLELDREKLVRLRSLTGDGFRLPSDWRKRIATEKELPRRSYSVTAIAGDTHALTLATIHTMVVDVENVSGGTGFAIIEVADPEIRECGQGQDFLVRVDFPPGGGNARLRVKGADVDLEEIRHVEVRFPATVEVQSTGKVGKSASTVGVGGTPVQRERTLHFGLPKQSAHFISFQRRVPLDQELILYTSVSPGKKAMVLVGKVKKVGG